MWHAGFTLIELAIVLVIIGLIVGGVLVGTDLIRNAQIRMQIKQLETYDTAVNTFKVKYNCLPGDCARATQFGFAVDGDGNGNIGLTAVSSTDSGFLSLSREDIYLWQHLMSANMLDYNLPLPTADVGHTSLPGINTPPLKFPGVGRKFSAAHRANPKGGISVASPGEIFLPNAGKSHVWLLSTMTFSFALQAMYLPKDAHAIDAKIDDGLPNSGKIGQGALCAGLSCPPPPADVTACSCAQPISGYQTLTNCASGNAYDIQSASLYYLDLCSLTVQTAF